MTLADLIRSEGVRTALEHGGNMLKPNFLYRIQYSSHIQKSLFQLDNSLQKINKSSINF